MASSDDKVHIACEGKVEDDRDMQVVQKDGKLMVQQEFSSDTDGCKDGSIGKGENSLSIMSNSGTVIVK